MINAAIVASTLQLLKLLSEINDMPDKVFKKNPKKKVPRHKPRGLYQ